VSIAGFGGLLIGCVLLVTGVGVIASGIDPLELCFKRCDIPKALVAMLGHSVVRVMLGAFFLALAALFLWPLFRTKTNR